MKIATIFSGDTPLFWILDGKGTLHTADDLEYQAVSADIRSTAAQEAMYHHRMS